MTNRRVRYVLGALTLAAALAGCGGKDSGQPAPTSTAAGSPTGSPTGSVTDQVTTLFQRFFDGTLPVDTKVGLLQKGDQFTEILKAQAAGPLAKSSGVKVIKVVQSTQNSAAVTFTVLLDGKPALENQAGGAVLDNGVWKVSASTYCTLLTLQGLTAPPCSGS
jgi:hypothetical protein